MSFNIPTGIQSFFSEGIPSSSHFDACIRTSDRNNEASKLIQWPERLIRCRLVYSTLHHNNWTILTDIYLPTTVTRFPTYFAIIAPFTRGFASSIFPALNRHVTSHLHHWHTHLMRCEVVCPIVIKICQISVAGIIAGIAFAHLWCRWQWRYSMIMRMLFAKDTCTRPNQSTS